MTTQPRFGSGSAGGRRMTVEPETREMFGKRDYDSEDRRQRRLGAYMTAAGAGGAGAAGVGVHGAVKDSKELRNIKIRGAVSKPDAKLTDFPAGKGAMRLTRRNAALIAAGVLGIGGAGAIRQHAEGPRGRRWN